MRTHKLLGSILILLIIFTIAIPYAAAQNNRPNPFDLIEMLQKRIQELELELDHNANRTLTNANQLNKLDKKFTDTTQSLDHKFTGITGSLDYKITNTTHQANNNANQLNKLDKKLTNTTQSLDHKFTGITGSLDHKITNTTHQANNNANQLKEFDKTLKNTSNSFHQKFKDFEKNIAKIESHDVEIIALKQNVTDVEKNVLSSLKKTKFRSQKSDLLASENKRDFVQELLLKKGITTIAGAKIDELKNLLPIGGDLKGLLKTCDLGTKFEAAKGQPESATKIFKAIKVCQALQRVHHIGLGDEDQFDEVSEYTALLIEELERLSSDPDTSL